MTPHEPISTAELKLDHVSRIFRRSGGEVVYAVNDVSVVIPPHEFVCVIGPSGCGKSTLLQLIAGLMPASLGAVLVDGVAVTGPSPERGLVFQKDSVFPWMRVIDNASVWVDLPRSAQGGAARYCPTLSPPCGSRPRGALMAA